MWTLIQLSGDPTPRLCVNTIYSSSSHSFFVFLLSFVESEKASEVNYVV